MVRMTAIFYREVTYEEVCAIIVACAGNQHDRLGTPHRHVLCRVEPDDVSLVGLGAVPGTVSKPESVSDAKSVSDPEPMSDSLLASVALLASWLGCHVV